MIILGLITAWLLAAPVVGILVGRAFSRGWSPVPDESLACLTEPPLADLGPV